MSVSGSDVKVIPQSPVAGRGKTAGLGQTADTNVDRGGDVDPNLVGLAPNGTNLGLFQIS